MWNLLFMLGVCSLWLCAAEVTVKYQKGGNVQYVPLAPQANVESDIKILQEQISTLLKQREYDRYLYIC